MELFITITGAVFTILLFLHNLKIGVVGDNVTLLKPVNNCQ
jgi:hypothetical protein